MTIQRADAVFEGGGTRGLAYVGALQMFERAGWSWQRVAGTSAGAIIAALIAAGRTVADIRAALALTDFRSFLDTRPLRRLWDTYWHLGACRGDAFEKWLDGLVGYRHMGELRTQLTVITCDLENGEIVPISSISHPDLPIARAVRMSMSIPFFFRAVRWQDGKVSRLCVDGGVCRNYPIEIFDVHTSPRWPTVGFVLEEAQQPIAPIRNASCAAIRMFEVMRGAPARELDEHNAYRTLRIRDGGVNWLNFNLSILERETLISNGQRAAVDFIGRWKSGGGFTGYVKQFREAAA